MAKTIYWQNAKMQGLKPQKRPGAIGPAASLPEGIASMIRLG